MKLSRISIPGRLIQLLLNDDDFFQQVSLLKKASSSGSFPKYDQWCDEFGFHMEFALAGYSKKDLEVLSVGQEIIIRSQRTESPPPTAEFEDFTDFCPMVVDVAPQPDKAQETKVITRKPNAPKINRGAIVRGIARRNFEVSFLIGQEFDTSSTKAIAKDGLLHLMVPAKTEIVTKAIEIVSGE